MMKPIIAAVCLSVLCGCASTQERSEPVVVAVGAGVEETFHAPTAMARPVAAGAGVELDSDAPAAKVKVKQ